MVTPWCYTVMPALNTNRFPSHTLTLSHDDLSLLSRNPAPTLCKETDNNILTKVSHWRKTARVQCDQNCVFPLVPQNKVTQGLLHACAVDWDHCPSSYNRHHGVLKKRRPHLGLTSQTPHPKTVGLSVAAFFFLLFLFMSRASRL